MVKKHLLLYYFFLVSFNAFSQNILPSDILISSREQGKKIALQQLVTQLYLETENELVANLTKNSTIYLDDNIKLNGIIIHSSKDQDTINQELPENLYFLDVKENKLIKFLLYNSKEFSFNNKSINLNDGDFVILKMNISGKNFDVKLVVKDTPINSEENKKDLDIAKHYQPSSNILMDAKLLLDKIEQKQYNQIQKEALLKEYNLTLSQAKKIKYFNNLALKTLELQSDLSQSNSNIAKTDVTNFATGMARFLADRAKAEMNENFFKVMYNHIDKNAELKHFFYQSHNYLNTSYSQNRMINMEAIKDVFEKDIRQFPVNIYDIKNLDDTTFDKLKGYKHFMNHTSGGKWVDYGFEIMRENNWRMNPKELIESMNSEKLASIVFDQIDPEFLKSKLFESIDYKTKEVYYAFKGKKLKEIKSENLAYLKKEISEFDFKKLSVKDYSRITAFLINESLISNKNYNLDYKLYNFVNSVKLLELISNSLLSPEENRYWVSSKEIESLFRDKALLETYLGLLIAKSEFDVYKISFMDNSGNIKSLKSLLEDVYENQNYLKFTNLVQDTHKTLNSVDEIAKGFASASNEAKLANVQRLFTFVGESLQTFNNHFNYRGIFKEKYTIDNDKFTKFVMPSIDITMHLQSKQYNLAIEDAVVLLSNIYQDDEFSKLSKSENKEQMRFINQFSKYGTLIANVATAQNSDEVKAAIEASVLPVGSSRIKRFSDWTLSTNAYVGGFYGNASYKVEGQKFNVSTFGISAPIGVTVSRGNLNFLGEKNSLSLNLQLIDLGSLVNFYHKKGDGAQLPADTKIQLGDILAPGASLSYSLFNSPFSIFTGAQYVPNLSRMESISTNKDFRPLTWRWHIGITIDIPLFILRTW